MRAEGARCPPTGSGSGRAARHPGTLRRAGTAHSAAQGGPSTRARALQRASTSAQWISSHRGLGNLMSHLLDLLLRCTGIRSFRSKCSVMINQKSIENGKNLLEFVICYQIVIPKFIIRIVFLHRIHFPSIKDLHCFLNCP